MTMRFHLPFAGDVPPATAARALGMTLSDFTAALPLLTGRGFPPADATTGNYDLDAIAAWRRARYPHLFGEALTSAPSALDARSVDMAARVASLPRRQRSG